MVSRQDLPPSLMAFLTETYGAPVSIERLTGVAGSGGAYRCQFSNGIVIVKHSQNPAESRFYERIAPGLRERQVQVPDLLWSGVLSGGYWLVLEEIRHPLPRGRWIADEQVLTQLVHLHAGTWNVPLKFSGMFEPSWDDGLTEAALHWFPTRTAHEVRPRLTSARQASQPLFERQCSISGDPNPTNWGVRNDGTTVLFDWERFGCGSPAVDLAITMPGTGSSGGALETLLASRYLALWQLLYGRSPIPSDSLVPQIRLAKLWTLVEFLASHQTGGTLPPAAQRTVDAAIHGLPGLLAGLRL